ncbi:MAG: efflux RND transporter periplasmic adaptor subunit [Bacteroidetes bacterium]|nr:efflux RND transporter periplasmic adaptor subunit [Bacteroidota bacterium]
MKNKIIYLSMAALVAACGSPDKKAELEKLKKQKSDIEAKITSIEEYLEKNDTAAHKEKATEILVQAIVPSIFKTYIEVQGRIDADENVALSSEIPGTVSKINVKVGNHVSKGDVLAETDSRATQRQIQDLQTNLDLAKQVYDKQKNLWEQKIGTEIQYLQAKTTKESLENKMAALQEQIRMSKIISPIDGTVDAVNIKVGQSIMPGLNAITVINFSNLKVKADVAESYANRIKTGNEVQILFPDMHDSINATLSYAARAISPLTRTFAVEVLLDGTKEYHPNMVAKLRINDFQSPTPEIVIPIKYIQRGTAESYVLVAENGKAEKRVLKTNREYNGLVEVSSGLNAGDMLITAGYDALNNGDAIVVKK